MSRGPSFGRWTFRVSAAAEERLVAELWALGTLGTESVEEGSEVRVVAYFPETDDAPVSAPDWGALGLPAPEVGEVERVDWLAEYRRSAVPFDLGRGFRVDSSDRLLLLGEGGDGRRLLRIPARTAFGTGTHPSTRLAVELLEERPPVGLDVLDVGTGSGILAMVALALGARRAVGLEIDPAAALVAGANRRLNDLSVDLVAGELAALAPARFDLVLMNMTLGNLERCLAALPRVVAAPCRGIFSGVLEDQVPALEAALAAAGFEPVGSPRMEDGWTAQAALRTDR